MENFSELKTLAPYKEATIKEDFSMYATSETVVLIKYKCGLKIHILRIPNMFLINYDFNGRKWSSNCGTVNTAITDVKHNIKILKDTKLIQF